MYLPVSSPITRLYLIRHAQTAHNLNGVVSSNDDTDLDEKGLDQANKLALRMKSQFPIDAIYSSPLARAMKTAEIIADAVNRKVSFYDDLHEVSFGIATSKRFTDLEESDPQIFHEMIDWVEAPFDEGLHRPQNLGFESNESIQNRIKQFTDKILKEHEGKRVAAVSHGGFIKCSLLYYASGSFDRKVPFFVDNASISIIDFYKGNPTIRLVNDISHTGDDLDLARPMPL